MAYGSCNVVLCWEIERGVEMSPVERIVIGSGEIGNSWCIDFRYNLEHTISTGRYSYLVHDGLIPGLEAYITHDSPTGRDLKRKLEGRLSGKLDAEPIDRWLAELMLRNAGIDRMLRVIERAMSSEYRRGKGDKLREIRSALGIE